jgi:hypothetical protein
MKTFTFFYVVGGDERYYNQLYKSIRSLEKLDKDRFLVKILDFDNKFEFNTDIEIDINYHATKPCSKEEYWKYKYLITQKLDTEYGIFLDCDTVICYDRLDEIAKQIGNSFGVVPHFYMKNFLDYKRHYQNNIFEHLGEDDLFYTGGVFFFRNNIDNMKTLSYIFDLHNQYELNQERGFYDETLLSYALSERDKVKMNGCYNHCSANLMPLKVLDNELVGKNPFDQEYERVFVLHGSSPRQFLGEDFSGMTKEMVTEFWK